MVVCYYDSTATREADMRWRIRTDSDRPIYEQIVDQAIYAVAEDALVPGEMIPSVRELAEQLLVNPNTVARAYQELERRGVVTARRGLGMEVTPEAPEACRTKRREMAAARLRDAVDDALGSGIALSDLRVMIDQVLSNGRGPRRHREKR